MFIIICVILIALLFIFFNLKIDFNKNKSVKEESKKIEPIIVAITKYDTNILKRINDSNVLGIIILIKNLEIEDLEILIINIKKIVKRNIIIALDEEREETYSSYYSKDFKVYPFYIGEKGSIEYAKKIALSRALALKRIGVNMLISPICNIDFYIQKNIFSNDEELASNLIYSTVLAYKSADMIVALKYFPKYSDSIIVEYDDYIDNIKTFNAGIKANADIILISKNKNLFNYFYCLLSKQLNFNKLTMTDYVNNKKDLQDNAINIISEDIFIKNNYNINTNNINRKLEELIKSL